MAQGLGQAASGVRNTVEMTMPKTGEGAASLAVIALAALIAFGAGLRLLSRTKLNAVRVDTYAQASEKD
jgi:LPXTG-motif cell wall-anchored protein